jgi:putative ABC transport system permease protein
VEDTQFSSIGTLDSLDVFIPFTQSSAGPLYVFVRSTAPDSLFAGQIRDIVKQSAAHVDVGPVQPLAQSFRAATSKLRLVSQSLTGFGFVAVLLCATGVYGMLSQVSIARRKERGIRIALGARPSDIVWHTVMDVVLPISLGASAGLALAAVFTSYVRSLLFNVQPLDSAAFGVGTAIFIAAISATVLIPAIRNCNVDPLTVLKSD